MYEKTQQRTAQIIIALAIVIPLLVLLWNVRLGVLLLFIGLFIAYNAVRLINESKRMERLQQYDARVEQSQSNQARLVYVQLVDDNGVELAPEVQEAKLARARLAAGPRDTVVGVKRKVD